MNKEVNFPIAKLLKEKGFNLKVIFFYDYERLSTPFDEQRQVDGLINYNPINWNGVKNHYTSAPTIAEVVMWLYEKHGIWISVDTDINGRFRYSLRKYNITNGAWEVKNPTSISEYFNSPTEAYEAAFEYALNNLIQKK